VFRGMLAGIQRDAVQIALLPSAMTLAKHR
jgi:hypothetical protein